MSAGCRCFSLATMPRHYAVYRIAGLEVEVAGSGTLTVERARIQGGIDLLDGPIAILAPGKDQPPARRVIDCFRAFPRIDCGNRFTSDVAGDGEVTATLTLLARRLVDAESTPESTWPPTWGR